MNESDFSDPYDVDEEFLTRGDREIILKVTVGNGQVTAIKILLDLDNVEYEIDDEGVYTATIDPNSIIEESKYLYIISNISQTTNSEAIVTYILSSGLELRKFNKEKEFVNNSVAVTARFKLR